MVPYICWASPGSAPDPRGGLVRSARSRRLALGAGLVWAGLYGTAGARTATSLIIESYPSTPVSASASQVVTVANRAASDSQVPGSPIVLAAAHALFAQLGQPGQGGATQTAAAAKAMRLLYSTASSDDANGAAACGGLDYRPSGMLGADNEETRRVLYPLVWREACRAGVPAGLLDALIIHESRYRVDAVSPRGAVGLTQLMPGTAANLGVNSWSIEDNIRGGAKYLHTMLASFGQYHLALAAYNAGPGAVTRSGGVPAYRETQAYVGDIIRRWSALAGN